MLYEVITKLHIDSGWVPADTRIDELESAVRTVCEPIFNKPLSEISFAQVIIRLFETARRFEMEIQPQLILLQKTLFVITSYSIHYTKLYDTQPIIISHLKCLARMRFATTFIILKRNKN